MRKFIFILLFTLQVLNGQEKFTLEDQFKLEYPSSISVSNDGNFTAFNIRKPDFENAKWASQIYLLNNKTKQIRQLTTHKSGVGNFTFSPDGKFVYFLSSREFQSDDGKTIKGEKQLWRISIDGGEAEHFLRLPNGVDEFTFSNDGKYLALLSDEEISDSLQKILDEKERTKNDEIVYPKENPKKEIWLYDFSSKQLKKIFKGDAGISNIRFSSKGNFLLYQTNYTGEYNDEQHHDIYKLTLDGTVTQLTDFEGPETEPQTSPDEKFVSFISQTVPDIEFAETDIELLDLQNMTRVNLTKNFGFSIINYIWHPKDFLIFALVNEGYTNSIYQIDVKKNSIKKIIDDGSVISNLKIAGNGELFFIYENENLLKEIGKLTKNQIELLTNYSEQIKKFKKGSVEIFSFKSYDKKFEIESMLVKPVDFDPSKKYPLILCVHGGPYSAFKRTFLQSYPMQVYANEGFVVVAPNVRGSAGYSDKFGQSNRYDLGGGDFQDAMQSVDEVIKMGFVDSTRMGVIGGSYGGYMTNWIISQTDRFAAAVSMYGIFSFFTDFSNSWQPIFEKMYFGYYYWEKPIEMNHLWVNRSPAFYVQNIKTPVLILQGDKDKYTNLANSQEMYQALKILGRTVEFVVYPREGHGIRNEPQHYLNMLNRGLNWFKKYLKNEEPSKLN
ncbi:MAG: S9 family peptidase [Ignavibacteria bacterium]|nr:S9 family peptidase [Ignavibacteria bacterium]